jgi:hypothetical protein
LFLSSMQNIKYPTDDFSVYGLYDMFVHLSICAVRGSIDNTLSNGCTCK